MVVAAARVSTVGVYAKEDRLVSEGLINYLMKNPHGTPFEHNMFCFFLHVPIFVPREFMRHRIGWSFNEESGRYKELDGTFYIPARTRDLKQRGKPGHYDYV